MNLVEVTFRLRRSESKIVSAATVCLPRNRRARSLDRSIQRKDPIPILSVVGSGPGVFQSMFATSPGRPHTFRAMKAIHIFGLDPYSVDCPSRHNQAYKHSLRNHTQRSPPQLLLGKTKCPRPPCSPLGA